MNENKTDRVRAELLRIWKYSTLFGLCMWAIQVLGPDEVQMAGFLAVYAPMTAALLGGEAANIAKRATAKPEVMLAEARIRNGGGHEDTLTPE